MSREITKRVRECHQCQVNKVQRHTKSKVWQYDIPSGRFEVVHIDIAVSLPPVSNPSSSLTSRFRTSVPYQHLLICVDRKTKWMEAALLVDLSAKTVAFAFV